MATPNRGEREPLLRFNRPTSSAAPAGTTPFVPDVEQPFPDKRTIRWYTQRNPDLPDPPYALVVAQSVLRTVDELVGVNLQHEIGGFLLGNRYRCPNTQREYVLIDQYSPALFTEATAVSLMFTAEAWAELAEQLQGAFLGKQLLGWYHSHPKMDVFLSQTDVELHTQRFPEPWMTALVIEPAKGLGGFFTWDQGRLDVGKVSPFYEYLDREAARTRATGMSWAGYKGIDGEAREEIQPRPRQVKVSPPPSDTPLPRPEVPRRSNLSMIRGAVAILVLATVIGVGFPQAMRFFKPVEVTKPTPPQPARQPPSIPATVTVDQVPPVQAAFDAAKISVTFHIDNWSVRTVPIVALNGLPAIVTAHTDPLSHGQAFKADADWVAVRRQSPTDVVSSGDQTIVAVRLTVAATSSARPMTDTVLRVPIQLLQIIPPAVKRRSESTQWLLSVKIQRALNMGTLIPLGVRLSVNGNPVETTMAFSAFSSTKDSAGLLTGDIKLPPGVRPDDVVDVTFFPEDNIAPSVLGRTSVQIPKPARQPAVPPPVVASAGSSQPNGTSEPKSGAGKPAFSSGAQASGAPLSSGGGSQSAGSAPFIGTTPAVADPNTVRPANSVPADSASLGQPPAHEAGTQAQSGTTEHNSTQNPTSQPSTAAPEPAPANASPRDLNQPHAAASRAPAKAARDNSSRRKELEKLSENNKLLVNCKDASCVKGAQQQLLTQYARLDRARKEDPDWNSIVKWIKDPRNSKDFKTKEGVQQRIDTLQPLIQIVLNKLDTAKSQ